MNNKQTSPLLYVILMVAMVAFGVYFAVYKPFVQLQTTLSQISSKEQKLKQVKETLQTKKANYERAMKAREDERKAKERNKGKLSKIILIFEQRIIERFLVNHLKMLLDLLKKLN